MEVRNIVFKDRNLYWKRRRSRELDVSKSHIGKLNATFSNVSQCPFCANRNPALLLPAILEDLRLTECKNCEKMIGADDSMTPGEIDTLAKCMKVIICPCGNENFERYTMQQKNEQDIFWRCEVCFNEISSDNKKSAVKNTSDFICIKCGNDDKEYLNFNVADENIDSIECLRCNKITNTQSLYDFADLSRKNSSSDTAPIEFTTNIKEASKAEIIGRIPVKKPSDLKVGDHIAWWRFLYWHHALVKEVYVGNNSVRVIHFSKGKGNSKTRKLTIKEEVLSLYKAPGVLYKIIYKGKCLSPNTALSQADFELQRSEKNAYWLLTNNCEHFVRWCKTGLKRSLQVLNFGGVVAKILSSPLIVDAEFLGKLLSKIILRVVTKSAIQHTVKTALLYKLTLGFGGIFALACEGVMFLLECAKSIRQFKANNITKRECCYQILSSFLISIFRGGGAVAGLIIGSIVCPIPVVGGLVGGFLGAAAGTLVGKGIGYVVTKKTTDKPMLEYKKNAILLLRPDYYKHIYYLNHTFNEFAMYI